MSSTVTDEQIRPLAATAKPDSVALLHWGPERAMDGGRSPGGSARGIGRVAFEDC